MPCGEVDRGLKAPISPWVGSATAVPPTSGQNPARGLAGSPVGAPTLRTDPHRGFPSAQLRPRATVMGPVCKHHGVVSRGRLRWEGEVAAEE